MHACDDLSLSLSYLVPCNMDLTYTKSRLIDRRVITTLLDMSRFYVSVTIRYYMRTVFCFICTYINIFHVYSSKSLPLPSLHLYTEVYVFRV